ncbi:MAG: Restriction endonuclease S subunit [Synergistales bacterium 53_16]|nr:MAG: Restriction endonuclease S subunit [Synergistales bacterium 53_16]
MITNLKPYPVYKDSGVEWLGQVPAHWEVLPGRTVFREINDRGYSDEQMLSVTITGGVMRQADLLADSSKKDSSNEDKSNYKLVQSGDLVYNKMRAWQGAVGVSAYRGIVSPAYIIQRLRNVENSPRYMHFLLRTPLFASEAERWSYGITSDQWSLRAEEFKCIYFSLPPLSEQTAIVRFLDYTDRRIWRVIRARQRQIKLLEEYKEALISQAVTGRMDVRTGQPYPSYKDSGVEWLGKVPAHWELKPLKRWVRINASVLPDTTPADYEFRYIDIGSVGTGFLTREPQQLRFSNAPSRARRVLHMGDTIISTVRTYLKAVYYVDGDAEALVCSSGFAVLTPGPSTQPKYVSYLVQSNTFTDRVTAESVGTAYPAIAEGRLGSFYVPIPPLPEQTAIAEYLDAQTARIDAAIEASRREIDLLREYRTCLISDVVTGKVDVREVAPQLPEEPPEQEVEWMDRNETAEAETADDDAAAEAFSKEEVET